MQEFLDLNYVEVWFDMSLRLGFLLVYDITDNPDILAVYITMLLDEVFGRKTFGRAA